MTRIKLFCFPYAGGSASVFNKWKQYLNPAIELMPIELAGRGKRINEALYQDVPELIDDVFKIVMEKIEGSQYALLGHSLGSMISYELAQKIRKNNLPPPLHAFFSGRKAPHVRRDDEKIYHVMGDDEFKGEVIKLGGTPEEFFDYPELMEIFLPFLRNDFRLAESELYSKEIHPLDFDITVFLGKADDLTSEECHGWMLHTNHLCSIHYFEGDHFFLNDKTKQLVRLVNVTLLERLSINRTSHDIAQADFIY